MPDPRAVTGRPVDEPAASDPAPASPDRKGRFVKGAAPLLLLAVLIVAFLRLGPVGVFRQNFPPVEELTIERITLPRAGEMRVRVLNGGPEPVTIAQVMVDDALWTHSLDGEARVGRLERRTITIPYPWVEGEPHEIAILTQTGLTFTGAVEVATRTPAPDARYLATFAMLGIYVGVVPVFLGILWLPFLRTIERRWIDFFLSLTVGLLVFLGVDAFAEALETAAVLPDAFQGFGLVLLGVLGTPLAIGALSHRGDSQPSPFAVSALIAIAIGLHNLGEGLAIGAAYATGSIALGTFLVLGFLIHNTTEGLGIVAPLARHRPRLGQLIALGAVAGVPTILGTWIGGFTYSPILTTLFFAVGTGAIIQVVWVLWRHFARRGGLSAPLPAAGLLLGLLIMYATGLLVTA
ncbi:MAG: ZIP family metal transporter [Gemmatimonadetes bacterium]|nr:ZIP family metal transporter [Gemmatimonadota bacterium]